MAPKAINTETPLKLQKRKEHPASSLNSQRTNPSRGPKRQKTQNARSILTQASDAALSNGELNLDSFLKVREFEIKALEDGMRRAKGALTTRAFQQVPRDMRRRTASHNVKRVPKRLQKRAKREMKDDNTPTVTPGKRKPGSSRGRLRAETAKRLGVLANRKRDNKDGTNIDKAKKEVNTSDTVLGRIPVPKARRNVLNTPAFPVSKYRKRQIHKSWLPTHMFHAKRAKMTEPSNPLWRFAVPITPTEKCYRPTHRAGGQRGALCWDMSYMSTIGMEGFSEALEKVLAAVGVTLNGNKGRYWREGKRTWSGWLSKEHKGHRQLISPGTVIWCFANNDTEQPIQNPKISKFRKIIIRIHPAAFLELWNQLLLVSKMQRPVVNVEDLRFEIGSIELTGPGSTEALLGILHQHPLINECHMSTFKSLAGVTNAASLPPNALLTMTVMDPRLRYPPQKIELPKSDNEEAAFKLLETLSAWPADKSSPSTTFFSREARHKAARLPSQKSLNRRRALAQPGTYPSLLPTDPEIPVLLYTQRSVSSSAQGSYTLLAPWKSILPIWYSLVHYPLSSGGNPRFSGLQELQQVNFELGMPWFPGDFPGTDAGWAWEIQEREKRKRMWDGRPKGKRTEYESLDLGAGRKGEIGLGWANDFHRLQKLSPNADIDLAGIEDRTLGQETIEAETMPGPEKPPFQQLSSVEFMSLWSDASLKIPTLSIATVRIVLLSRGVPQSCARIYCLPVQLNTRIGISDLPINDSTTDIQPLSNAQPSSASSNRLPADIRQQWLSLAPARAKKTRKAAPSRSLPISATPAERREALAQELFHSPPAPYPAPKSEWGFPVVPDEQDLIGFVTTGNFNLAKGLGSGIGSVVVAKVMYAQRAENKNGSWIANRMCIVRNAGESIGRLGYWEAV